VTTPWSFDALHADLARAALDPAHWKPALQRLTDSVGAVGTVLLPPVAQRFSSISTDSIGEVNARYFAEGWNSRDQRDRGLVRLRQCGVTVDLDFATEEEIARSDYYNDFLGRHGLRWFAGLAASAGGEPCSDVWVISIQRSIAQGPFVPAEQERLARLRGSFGTAVTMARELSLARARGLAEAFEILGSAAVVLDWRGDVILANATARRTLTGELRIAKRRLTAGDSETCRSIAGLVDRVTSPLLTPAPRPPVAVPRPGRRPLIVYAVPVVGETRDIFTHARALLVVLDPDARPMPPEEALRAAFGLTSAEARLAARLGTGESLDDAAEALAIAKETARYHLKQVFDKTGAQSELVALLARLAGPAPPVSGRWPAHNPFG
jgi:DNA-binding CsgD family transcriptional regulator